MLILITYDVTVTSENGKKRLRNIAKLCLNYGLRVQNSVFECEVDGAQWLILKNQLLSIYDESQDSLRFYILGRHGRQKVEHFGAKKTPDVLRDLLIF